MFNWLLRPSSKRLPHALHTPAPSPGRGVREEGDYINQTIDDGKQTWVDCEEAMADLYLNLLALKKTASGQQNTALDLRVSRVFDSYSGVLSSFALYLEACSGSS